MIIIKAICPANYTAEEARAVEMLMQGILSEVAKETLVSGGQKYQKDSSVIKKIVNNPLIKMFRL